MLTLGRVTGVLMTPSLPLLGSGVSPWGLDGYPLYGFLKTSMGLVFINTLLKADRYDPLLAPSREWGFTLGSRRLLCLLRGY